MVAIITLLLILIISITITKIATIALTHTGLSKETAKFQARSAFTGVGFTTSESEKVVNNPVRRKVLLLLMILGNAGIVTGVSTLIIGFVKPSQDTGTWVRVAILLAGVVILWNLANSNFIERRLSNWITRLIKKGSTIDVVDYSSLLHLSGEYRIAEIPIEEGHWLSGKLIRDTGLRKEGIIVLGINRLDGTYIGAPQPDSQLEVNDSILAYGRARDLKDLEARGKGRKGDIQHKKTMKEFKEVVKQEKKKEQEKEQEGSKSKSNEPSTSNQ
jgi:hypothetical protein